MVCKQFSKEERQEWQQEFVDKNYDLFTADHLTIIHLAFCLTWICINSLLDPPFGYLRHSLLRTRKWHRLRHHECDRSHCLVFEIGRSILCQCSRGCWKPQEFGVFIKKARTQMRMLMIHNRSTSNPPSPKGTLMWTVPTLF